MLFNKKVGIITWHYYPNFGSALQAYALHKFINNNGGDAFIINYIVGKKPSFWKLRLFIGYFDFILPRSLTKHLHYRFLQFHKKYFRETEPVYEKESLTALSKTYDTIICGSDQIWAPNVFNDIYMLSFVPEEQRKVSYAASIGLPTIPQDLKSSYLKLLKRFQFISVREQQGSVLLKKEFDIESEVVLDPTLLLTGDEWRSIAKYPSSKNKKKYILCYFLGQNEKHRILVEELAESIDANIICLSRFPMDIRPKFTTDTDAGPREFIGYIDHAEYVITDSFHGLCFSINLRKNFYVVRRFSESDKINQNSRIENILSIVGLEDRLINECPKDITCIDYSSAASFLENMKVKSIAFLKKAVN